MPGLLEMSLGVWRWAIWALVAAQVVLLGFAWQPVQQLGDREGERDIGSCVTKKGELLRAAVNQGGSAWVTYAAPWAFAIDVFVARFDDGEFAPTQLECADEQVVFVGAACDFTLALEDVRSLYLAKPHIRLSCAEWLRSRPFIVIPRINLRFTDAAPAVTLVCMLTTFVLTALYRFTAFLLRRPPPLASPE